MNRYFNSKEVNILLNLVNVKEISWSCSFV